MVQLSEMDNKPNLPEALYPETSGQVDEESGDQHIDSAPRPAAGPEAGKARSEGPLNDMAAASESLLERLVTIETRFTRLEDIYDPKDLDYKPEDDSESEDDQDDSYEWASHRMRLSTVLWFLGRSRAEFERYKKRDQERRAKRREAKAKALSNDVKLESLEEISTAACLNDEPAQLGWVDWRYFIASKGRYEDSVMSPIDAVNGEPEPQIIVQLKNMVSTSQTKDKRPSGNRTIERPKGPDDVVGQMALPERIKVHSGPLYNVLRGAFKARTLWTTAEDDGSTVFLRPFREFIYYEQQLRESLAHLEERSENPKNFKNKIGQSIEAGPDGPDVKQAKSSTESGIEQPVSNVDEAQEKRGPQVGEEEESARHKVDKETESPNPVTSLLHLRCLVKFIDDEIKPKLEYINSDKCRKLMFHDLWHLFKPGNEVVDQKEKQAYRIVRVEIPRHKIEDPWLRWTYRKPVKQTEGEEEPEEDTPVKVHCAYIDFDGKQFGPVSVKFSIPPYGGLKEVKALPIYPLRFAKDAKIRDNLIERGKMLLSVSKYKSMYYSGVTLDTRDEIDSQVVVDFSEALANEKRKDWIPKIEGLRTGPDTKKNKDKCSAACCLGQGVSDDEYVDSRLTEDFVKSLIPDQSLRAPSLLLSPRPLEETQPGSDDEPTHDELVVMTYRVFGFVLRSRKWAQLDLTFLRYENTDARTFTLSAFDQLELPEGHRDMVKSLVTQHFRDRQTTNDEQTDLIRGKGKGLILLLHGAPGVGKTTTAEGVAELFQKPLFQITCGDLGNTARDVEVELEKNFALASRWGCILLLDEADVFLSARERKDFERNGLVAVFLRVLEYYAGILFLTTNRIGDFDEAFASRIHMSLYYPALDEAKTKKIFTLNLDLIQQRFNQQARKITYDASSIESFAGQHFQKHKSNRWNGRQIRNLCQTALALAEFDAHGRGIDGKVNTDATVQLQLKYFQTVQKAYLEFDQYLGDIRGTQGDQRAYDNALRAKKDTPFETTPSRFSTKGDARHASSLSESQSSVQGDPFQPLVNQNYQGGASPNTRPTYGQYYPPGQVYTGNPGMTGYDAHPSYSQPGGQQGNIDPRFYQAQQPPHMGFSQPGHQGWGAPNTPLPYNRGGPAAPLQQLQGQGQGQGQNPQVQSPYGYPNMQGGVQGDTMSGTTSVLGQAPPGGTGGGAVGVGNGSGVGIP